MVAVLFAFLALPLNITPPQDKIETKKKRLAELFKQMSQIQVEAKKLLEDLTGGDREKTDAIMKEVLEKYAPEMATEFGRSRTASNERNASATLKTIATAQADFRANDRDNNRVNDFWVADVSGLYRIDVGGAIKLIEQSAALADAKPCLPLDESGNLPGAPKEHASRLVAMSKPAPKAGYWYSAIESYQDDKGAILKYDRGNGRNPSAFGFFAYPADYGKTGKLTFILSEENVLWMKDTGGKPPNIFPFDPAKMGWKRMD